MVLSTGRTQWCVCTTNFIKRLRYWRNYLVSDKCIRMEYLVTFEWDWCQMSNEKDIKDIHNVSLMVSPFIVIWVIVFTVIARLVEDFFWDLTGMVLSTGRTLWCVCTARLISLQADLATALLGLCGWRERWSVHKHKVSRAVSLP